MLKSRIISKIEIWVLGIRAFYAVIQIKLRHRDKALHISLVISNFRSPVVVNRITCGSVNTVALKILIACHHINRRFGNAIPVKRYASTATHGRYMRRFGRIGALIMQIVHKLRCAGIEFKIIQIVTHNHGKGENSGISCCQIKWAGTHDEHTVQTIWKHALNTLRRVKMGIQIAIWIRPEIGVTFLGR